MPYETAATKPGEILACELSLDASRMVERIGVLEGFHVFRGVEITTDRGHLLVYGLKDDSWNVWTRNNYLDCIKVMERVHALGGICVPAHPFRGHDSLGESVVSMDGLDAIETHNGLNMEHQNLRAIQVARDRDLPSIGGSDCHDRMQVGRACTDFQNAVHTMEGLIREIKRGHCEGVYRNDEGDHQMTL